MTIMFGLAPGLACRIIAPTTRGVFALGGGQAYALQSLPEDAIGTFTLTLTGVISGSAIQIETLTGTPLHNGTAAASTVTIPLQAYAAGSPFNDLRIKVRKGSSAPFFQPYETQTTAAVGAQSIFVSQIPDE